MKCWSVYVCDEFQILRLIVEILWQFCFLRISIVNFLSIYPYFENYCKYKYWHLFKEFICKKTISKSEFCSFCNVISVENKQKSELFHREFLENSSQLWKTKYAAFIQKDQITIIGGNSWGNNLVLHSVINFEMCFI